MVSPSRQMGPVSTQVRSPQLASVTAARPPAMRRMFQAPPSPSVTVRSSDRG